RRQHDDHADVYGREPERHHLRHAGGPIVNGSTFPNDGPGYFFKKSWPLSRVRGALSHVKHPRPVPEKEPPMQLFSWLHKRMTGRSYTRRTSARKLTGRFRPQLETLEGRDLPSFSSPVPYALSGAQALVTADVNGDGKPDLISLVNYGADIAVQLNNGKGTFGTPAYHYDGASGTDIMTALTVGYVNGKPEIVVAGW